MAHHIVTIVGSLRKESYSLKIANALAKLAPSSLSVDVVTLAGISFFNQDLEATPPADWTAFRDKLQKSNGVLFGIQTPDGETAHTACLGFGLERNVMALFRHHGFDPKEWPADVRKRLWP